MVWNTISAFIYQGVAVVCGFILPRAILNRHGSDVNGLINSIAQFLQMITFLELGVGAVVQSALYRPLAQKDSAAISEVLASGSSFFRKLAGIMVVYVAVLVFLYPLLIDAAFGFVYDATLILSMSISYFAQYYFGIMDGLLLKADQKAYIIHGIDTVTLVVNTLFCYCLLYWGCSIQVVKLATSGIFLLRPILVRIYIRKNYQIDRHCSYDKDSLAQKWNGVAQHVAAIVLDSTDVVVLSLFSTMYAVSVYSVYLLVVSGIKSLFMSCFNSVRSLFGELWAKQEHEELNRYFGFMEWLLHGSVLFVWCCTFKLIVPFVLIYTEHMTDTNYDVPVFAALLCIAYGLFCIRILFHNMILAAGDYKNTQNIYFVGAAINLITSILAVRRWGLVGVTVGTLIAMLYQMLHMGYYVIRHLGIHSFGKTAKQFAVDAVTILLVLCVTGLIPGTKATWMGWIFLAAEHAVVIGVCILIINLVFYKKESMQILGKVFRKK